MPSFNRHSELLEETEEAIHTLLRTAQQEKEVIQSTTTTEADVISMTTQHRAASVNVARRAAKLISVVKSQDNIRRYLLARVSDLESELEFFRQAVLAAQANTECYKNRLAPTFGDVVRDNENVHCAEHIESTRKKRR